MRRGVVRQRPLGRCRGRLQPEGEALINRSLQPGGRVFKDRAAFEAANLAGALAFLRQDIVDQARVKTRIDRLEFERSGTLGLAIHHRAPLRKLRHSHVGRDANLLFPDSQATTSGADKSNDPTYLDGPSAEERTIRSLHGNPSMLYCD